MNVDCGRAQLSVGGATTGQVALSYIRKPWRNPQGTRQSAQLLCGVCLRACLRSLP